MDIYKNINIFWNTQRISFIDPFQSLVKMWIVFFLFFFFFSLLKSKEISKYKIIEMKLEKKICIITVENRCLLPDLNSEKKMHNYVMTWEILFLLRIYSPMNQKNSIYVWVCWYHY